MIVVWTIIVFFLALYSTSAAVRNYRRSLERCLPLTPNNAWLLLFGAKVVEPPSVVQYWLAWALVWVVGVICLVN